MTAPDTGAIAAIVRPYTRTGGRTRSSLDLPLEAMITTTPGPDHRYSHPDHREIARLCQEIRSVAEIASMLNLPLGVARVLIGDMAHAGLLAVHDGAPPGGTPDLALLERVLSGLRRL